MARRKSDLERLDELITFYELRNREKAHDPMYSVVQHISLQITPAQLAKMLGRDSKDPKSEYRYREILIIATLK